MQDTAPVRPWVPPPTVVRESSVTVDPPQAVKVVAGTQTEKDVVGTAAVVPQKDKDAEKVRLADAASRDR